MRRPHRSVSARIRRKALLTGRELPASLRRRFRPFAERLGVVGTPKAVVRPPRGAQPTVVTEYDAWRTVAELATLLRQVLAEADVEIACLTSRGRSLIVVADTNRPAALAALHASPRCADVWVRSARSGGTPCSDPDVLSVAGDSLTIFRFLAAPTGEPVAAAEAGVRVEFWHATTRKEPRIDGGHYPVGTLLAPRRNPVAPYLTPRLWSEAQRDPERSPRPEAPPHLLTVREPIDVVYTWVDDTDPEWRRRRSTVQPPGDRLASDALDPARTTNRDELRYSLRSLSMYANWVRRVWLVTDGQVPAWLNRDEPRLTVVTHREIFSDPAALPTFNSHAIESQLHHIPGLAEHFLYLNDDVFFGRPVRPELFFHANGVAKFAVSSLALDRDADLSFNGATLAARRNREFLESRLQRTVTQRMQHTPHAHVLSTLKHLERTDPELIAAVARSKFRSAGDVSIASDLGHYFAYAMRRAVTATMSFQYVDIGLPTAQEHLASLLANRDRDCFCVNDVGGYDQPVDEDRLQRFFELYFPVPCLFEKP